MNKGMTSMMQRFIKPLILGWFPLALLCWNVEAAQGEKEMTAETADHRAELIECFDGINPATNIPKRECTIGVTDRAGEEQRMRFGGGYLSRSERFIDMRIIGNTLLMLTDATVIAFDLNKSKEVKIFAAMSASFLPGRNIVLFDEWELRHMPPDVRGRVISVLDLKTLERRPIFPETQKLFEFPVHPVSEPRLEPFLRPREEDPSSRCYSSRDHWSPDNSRFAFSCDYNLTETGLLPGEEGPSGVDVVIVELPPDITDSTFKRFRVYDRLCKKDVKVDSRQGWDSIDKLQWLSNDVLEIVAKRKGWLHSGATINVITGEILVKD